MREIFELILGYVPLYVPQLARTIGAPLAFFREGSDSTERFRASFVFFGISLTLAEAARFASRSELARTFVEALVSTLVEAGVLLLGLSAIATFAWRVVGGNLRFERVLAIVNYTLGTAWLVLSLLFASEIGFLGLVVTGFARAWATLGSAKDPAAFATIERAVEVSAAAHPFSWLGFGGIFLLCDVVVLVWFVLTLARALRALDPLSLRRTALAVVFASVASLIATPFFLFLSLAT